MRRHPMVLYVDAACLSPCAMSGYVALHEKGIPFELRFVDLDNRESRAEPFSALSSTRRVPMLVDGTFALSEASAIAEYVNETIDGPELYPGNARERARARQVQAWLRSDFGSIRRERTTQVIFDTPNPVPLSDSASQQAELLFEAANAWLGHAAHVCGKWSMADVDLTIMLSRLVCNKDAVPRRLERYVREQWRRPSLCALRILCGGRALQQ